MLFVRLTNTLLTPVEVVKFPIPPVPILTVLTIGVISYSIDPSTRYNLFSVPTDNKFSVLLLAHVNISLAVPKTTPVPMSKRL